MVNAVEFVAPVADDIHAFADKAEESRKLPSQLFKRLVKAGLFSIYTPTDFGGMGLPLPEALRIVEEVSRHDGSTGWTVALGFGNDLFTSVLQDEAAAQILGTGSCLLAGSPGFEMRAVAVEGGYCLTGKWHFGSGASNAMWFNTLAPVFDRDEPRLGPDGIPEFIMAFMTPNQVEVIDTWHVTGLRASASHDLRVEKAFVPTELAGVFSMHDLRPFRASILARIPFMNLLAIVQAPPVCLGIARHAVDAFVDLARSKERGGSTLSEQAPVQVAIAQAEAKIRSGCAYFYAVAERIWEKAVAHETFSEEDKADMRMACLTATENALAVVDAMYRLGGATSIYQSCPLERLWRDVHTASQHIQVQDSQWVGIGKSLLGISTT